MSETDAIIIATMTGPVAAVAITLWYQGRAQRYERRLNIFRALMQWRRNWLHAEWVGALNLVPVEFAGHADIIRSFGLLIDKLEDRGFTEKGDLLTAAYNRAETEFAELMHKISRVLRINLAGLDLRGRGYAPSGWWREQQAVEALRSASAAVLVGERSISVRIVEE